MKKALLLATAALLAISCGSKSTPTSPSTNPPPTASPTRIINLSGAMDFGNIQVGQSFSATLHIGNAGNSPLTVTGITGNNNITSVLKANWTSGSVPAGGNQDVVMTFTPGAARTYSGTITVNGDHTSGTNTIAFSGTGSVAGLPVFSRSGTGANVFDVPAYVARVRITGTYAGRCENFVVWIANDLLVNEILGTCSIASGRNYDGTHLIEGGAGGVAEVKSSTGINWTITEVR